VRRGRDISQGNRNLEKHTCQRLSDVAGRQFDVGLSSSHVRMPSENKVDTPSTALATLKANFEIA
jgi:hypothetical protein